MLRLIFVRHGEYAGVVLTERGEESIKALADRFRNAGIVPDKMFTSPAIRTLQSAGILRDELMPEMNIDGEELLAEGFGGDDSEGKFVKEVMPVLSDEFRTVVCVTHDPVVNTNNFVADASSRPPQPNIKNGQARVIEFKDDVKTWAQARGNVACSYTL